MTLEKEEPVKQTRSIPAAVVIAALLIISAVASAQWSGKPPAEWSEKEAMKLLSDSPWGQTLVFGNPSDRDAAPHRDADSSRTIDIGGSRINRAAQVNYRVAFLSARPVREAISRLLEINQGGKVNEDMAAQLKSFVEEDYKDHVIISVFFDAPRPTTKLYNARELLDNLTLERLKANTYLSVEGGERVRLQEYIPPHGNYLGARFVFPRMVKGEPLATLQNISIHFHSELDDAYTLDKSFKLGAMIYKNRLEY